MDDMARVWSDYLCVELHVNGRCIAVRYNREDFFLWDFTMGNLQSYISNTDAISRLIYRCSDACMFNVCCHIAAL